MSTNTNRVQASIIAIVAAVALFFLLMTASGCATASRTLGGLDQHRCDDVQLNSANNRMSMCNRSGFEPTSCFADAIVSSCEAP
jgi:hypothetical protein